MRFYTHYLKIEVPKKKNKSQKYKNCPKNLEMSKQSRKMTQKWSKNDPKSKNPNKKTLWNALIEVRANQIFNFQIWKAKGTNWGLHYYYCLFEGGHIHFSNR
jgi:hypothetical protein